MGVEIVDEAVRAARENAALNGLDNCMFWSGDVLKVIDELGEVPDLIMLDPPRDGVNPKALMKILNFGVDRIVYIACKPTSLARDLEMIQGRGYKVEKISCIDLFPGTVHVETVCLLTRKNVKSYAYVDVNTDELDIGRSKNKATYKEIMSFVEEKYGFKVSALYIAGVKDELGLEKQFSYEDNGMAAKKRPNCPKEKHDAIVDALVHFGIISAEKSSTQK